MLRVRLAPEEATTTQQLLKELGATTEIPPQLRDAADVYAAEVHSTMRRRDLQRIAWLLRSACEEHHLPRVQQRTVRRWAAYLEGRI